MKTISCPSCNVVNSTDESSCTNCGASLVAAIFEQSVNELSKATEHLRELSAPRKSFYSINGCGTTLLDYRALVDGTYAATRWVVVFGLPIVPLSGYVIEPTSQEHSYGQETSKFTILNRTPLSISRVLRIYALAAIGLVPIILGSINSRWVNHTLGGALAFFAMIAAFGWLIYIIFFRLKNDSKAYKAKNASHNTNSA
ncbi:MAG: hypothetical protein M3R68_03220 [Acidobacteriota bacterium]|nr:hypothetical protein [Acidobacteriota bacterium]